MKRTIFIFFCIFSQNLNGFSEFLTRTIIVQKFDDTFTLLSDLRFDVGLDSLNKVTQFTSLKQDLVLNFIATLLLIIHAANPPDPSKDKLYRYNKIMEFFKNLSEETKNNIISIIYRPNGYYAHTSPPIDLLYTNFFNSEEIILLCIKNIIYAMDNFFYNPWGQLIENNERPWNTFEEFKLNNSPITKFIYHLDLLLKHICMQLELATAQEIENYFLQWKEVEMRELFRTLICGPYNRAVGWIHDVNKNSEAIIAHGGALDACYEDFFNPMRMFSGENCETIDYNAYAHNGYGKPGPDSYTSSNDIFES